MVRTQLGVKVRQARSRKELSLDRLSKIAGVGLRTIHAIEQGESRHPTEETLRRLATALGIPYRDLALAAYGADGDTPAKGDS
jgi:repressor LexA